MIGKILRTIVFMVFGTLIASGIVFSVGNRSFDVYTLEFFAMMCVVVSLALLSNFLEKKWKDALFWLSIVFLLMVMGFVGITWKMYGLNEACAIFSGVIMYEVFAFFVKDIQNRAKKEIE